MNITLKSIVYRRLRLLNELDNLIFTKIDNIILNELDYIIK